jgi:hypothetical protein
MLFFLKTMKEKTTILDIRWCFYNIIWQYTVRISQLLLKIMSFLSPVRKIFRMNKKRLLNIIWHYLGRILCFLVVRQRSVSRGKVSHVWVTNFKSSKFSSSLGTICHRTYSSKDRHSNQSSADWIKARLITEQCVTCCYWPDGRGIIVAN